MNRLIQRLRKNPDFQAATAYLNELGIAWELVHPRGKGHPSLRIGETRYPISVTPSARVDQRRVRSSLRAHLQRHGLIPGGAS